MPVYICKYACEHRRGIKTEDAVLGTETTCFTTVRSTDATSIKLLALLQRF